MWLNSLGCLGSGLSCLQNWWQADRIRVSPQQGRLVGIQLPALLEITGEQWTLQSRHQDMINGQKVIRYVCVKHTESCELWVFMPNSDDWRSRVFWVCGGEPQPLEESLVTVYPLANK